MSDEDVIPKWMKRLYPDQGWWRHEHAHPDLNKSKVKRAKGPRVISRRFCEDCNTGWMSRLETASKGSLGRMIKGEAIRLDRDAQGTLAFWVAKTTLAFESIEPETHRFAERELFRRLYELQEAPPDLQIWLARRGDGDIAWRRSHSLRDNEGADAGFGSTLSLGDLVIHAVWHPAPQRRFKVGRSLAAYLIQIHPMKKDSRLWPSALPIGSGKADLSWLGLEVAARSEIVAA
jgi:hypothetical protein